MCDTFVALADTNNNNQVIFGKNSDRPKGEIQDIVTYPAQQHEAGTKLSCTYIDIPQVTETHAVILSKPRWMWGAEMGANEAGVVIGNEAVWTIQACADTGLLGMDLVRLGLERGDSAYDAMLVITGLLDEHGQGGNCAEHFTFNYHNSFLIADINEAWVLETSGQYWVAEKITSGTRSISNNLSIHGRGDLQHPELHQALATEGITEFDFARFFSVDENIDADSPDTREGRVRYLCKQNENNFTRETAQSILRDHHGNVCMHDDFESRGSQVSELSAAGCQHWFIEEPFPCQQEYQLKNFN